MGLGHTQGLKIRQNEVLVFSSVCMISPEPREEGIVRQARERLGAECAGFLDGACAGDLALLKEVFPDP